MRAPGVGRSLGWELFMIESVCAVTTPPDRSAIDSHVSPCRTTYRSMRFAWMFSASAADMDRNDRLRGVLDLPAFRVLDAETEPWMQEHVAAYNPLLRIVAVDDAINTLEVLVAIDDEVGAPGREFLDERGHFVHARCGVGMRRQPVRDPLFRSLAETTERRKELRHGMRVPAVGRGVLRPQ